MERQPFFSLDLRQPVNQWICIALLALMCFWVVLYYLVHRAEAFGNDYSAIITGVATAAPRSPAATRHTR